MHRVDGWFRVDKRVLSGEQLLEVLRRPLVITNYDWKKAQEMGFKFTGSKWENLFEETEEELLLPRDYGLGMFVENGFLTPLVMEKSQFLYTDERTEGENIDFGVSEVYGRL